MIFDIITIFPEIFESYFGESIIARAKKNGIIGINVHNLRDYSEDKKHMSVDDTPYGGGAGMVLQVEPIYNALVDIVGKNNLPCFRKSVKPKTKIILFSAKGNKYKQAVAGAYSKFDRVVMICGRYEGVDERVARYLVDEEVSIGDYVLTGGEIPAMVVVDSVSRLLEGVLGNRESIVEESFSSENYLEYPQYTKPEVFSPKRGVKWDVPEILLSGHHKNIKEWRDLSAKK